jgi:class 3 adenylate cyclase
MSTSIGTELPSGTVTFLFTDIEGSTALLKQLGRGRLRGRACGALRDPPGRVLAHGGQVVDTQGDSFFAASRAAIFRTTYNRGKAWSNHAAHSRPRPKTVQRGRAVPRTSGELGGPRYELPKFTFNRTMIGALARRTQLTGKTIRFLAGLAHAISQTRHL